MIQEKDAYYFPHDSNAHEDPKCVLLIEQLGTEGYGIFWILVELLRDQPGYRYPLALIPSIARKYNTTSEKVGVVIKNYDLFVVTGDSFFYSESLNRRMELWEYKREMAVTAGKESAKKRLTVLKNSTGVQPTLNGGSTIDMKEDDMKEDEKKNIRNKIPPTFEDVQRYCMERQNGIDPQYFIDYYSARGWMISKNKIKDWQACIRTWEKNNGYVKPTIIVNQPDPARERAKRILEGQL